MAANGTVYIMGKSDLWGVQMLFYDNDDYNSIYSFVKTDFI